MTGSEEKRGKTPLQAAIGSVLKFFPVLIGVGIILLITGFLYFASEVDRLSKIAIKTKADGIVVLTGDGARIAKALELLRDGMGKRLLITGVHEKTSRKTIRRITGSGADLFDCCVDIDRAALDTVGNAKEAGSWAQNHGFNKIIIVTSDYHMPRSMVEFSRIMPEAEIIPVAVKNYDDSPENPDHTGKNWHTVGAEYIKYVIARMRLGIRETENRSSFVAALAL